jgi:putative aldouronate transport system substrate-binding protein
MNKKWLVCTMLVAMLFVTACSSKSSNGDNTSSPAASIAATTSTEVSVAPATPASEKVDPYGKEKEPVTINIAQMLPVGDAGLPKGQTVEDNAVTKFYEDKLNIKLTREWSAVKGDPYDQKVMLAIASRQIPDVMQVNEEQLRLLVKANLIEDLTDVFSKYASDKVRELQVDLAKNTALETATFGGKLYAIPSIAIKGDAVTMLWLRKDWLDKLKLPEPKTLDDIEAISKAFIDNKMGGAKTIGMTGPNTPELANDKGNRSHGFDAVFSAFHSFPGNWIKNKDGKVTYGSIEPESKLALAKLRDWYSKGLIDKEFFLRENPDESFLSGQNGLLFGPWWYGWGNLTQTFDKIPEAQWKAYAAPVDSEGKHVTHLQPVSRDYLVIRKGFEHPEAVMKAYNLRLGLTRRAADIPAEDSTRWAAEVTTINKNLDVFQVNADDIEAVTHRRHMILDAIDGKIDPKTLAPEVQEAYDFAKKYMDDSTVVKYYPQAIKDGLALVQTGSFQAYIIGGAPLDNTYEEVSSLIYSPTETMKVRWANLKKLENETFLKIVIGGAPIDSFDAFVKQWRSIGGDKIISEVEEAIKK